MNSEQQRAAIERLRELEKKATPGEWFTDPEFEHSLTALCRATGREDILFGACDWPDADYICALRNEALPLIEDLQAENERLRAGIGRAVQKLEASDLIDLAHGAINEWYGAEKACIQKALREMEDIHDA